MPDDMNRAHRCNIGRKHLQHMTNVDSKASIARVVCGGGGRNAFFLFFWGRNRHNQDQVESAVPLPCACPARAASSTVPFGKMCGDGLVYPGSTYGSRAHGPHGEAAVAIEVPCPKVGHADAAGTGAKAGVCVPPGCSPPARALPPPCPPSRVGAPLDAPPSVRQSGTQGRGTVSPM